MRGAQEQDGISGVLEGVIFFFKQKAAYELLRSLVGSEMCMRDRDTLMKNSRSPVSFGLRSWLFVILIKKILKEIWNICETYTTMHSLRIGTSLKLSLIHI